jgi:glycosyltransferase involved in cell wall biosynthesis
MRVLQAMAGARHGGAETFFARLVPALARAGVAQAALVRPEPERLSALRAAGVRLETAPFRRRLDLVTRRRFRRLIEEFRPDIVLTWMNRASAACPPGEAIHCARLGGYYDLKDYRRCDHLIGNTPDIVAYLRRGGWPAERVHYLPNFVPERQAPPLDRSSLDTPADAPLLLALGRLHPAKGFDVLLAALAALPGAWLWLAGDGPQAGRLKGLALRHGVAERVRFLGWRADVPALFAAADLLVCPSRAEPFGNVVVEAWAQRRPVIAAASSGPQGLIAEGESGLLVPADDADALAQAIRRLLHSPDLAAALAERGRLAYETHFTEAAVVARWGDLFARLAR